MNEKESEAVRFRKCLLSDTSDFWLACLKHKITRIRGFTVARTLTLSCSQSTRHMVYEQNVLEQTSF
jgi:hypothetical protein